MTRSDTNRTVQPQRMARGLEFRTYKVEGLLYLNRGNKGANQLCVYCAALSVYCAPDLRVFSCICMFSHDAAQMICFLMNSDNCFIISSDCVLRHEKTCLGVFYQVRHIPDCAITKYD